MIDSVYRERSHLVALLASMYPSTIGYHDPQEPDWAVVTVWLPTGQVSWHVAPDDMDLFGHVRQTDVSDWDGHTTEEKYGRIDAYTRANAEGYGEVV